MSQDVIIISSEIHYLFHYQRLGIHSRIAVVNLAETLSLLHFLFRQHTLETGCPMANQTTLPRSPLCWHRVLNRQVRRFPYSWHRAHWPPFAPWSSRLFNYQTTAHHYRGWKNAYGIFVVLLQFVSNDKLRMGRSRTYQFDSECVFFHRAQLHPTSHPSWVWMTWN
jgi:hypothetical protein